MIIFTLYFKKALSNRKGKMNHLYLKLKIGIYNGLNFLYKPLAGRDFTRTHPYLVLFMVAVVLAILLFWIGSFFFEFLD